MPTASSTKSCTTTTTTTTTTTYLRQVLAGANGAQRATMQLGSLQPEDFALLQQSGCINAELIDDVADFGVLLDALLNCGLDEQEIHELLSIVAGLLHLGNVQFADGHDGYAAVSKDSAASMASAAQLLGTQFEEPIITQVPARSTHPPKVSTPSPDPGSLPLTQPFARYGGRYADLHACACTCTT